MSLFEEAHFWEAAGLILLVIVLVWVKVPQMAVAEIDARINGIKARLAEATRLREEAERLLAEIRTRHEAAERQVGEIMALAKVEAERFETEAKVKLEEQIRRRAEQAERRIALAEGQAANEVRAAAADLAAQAVEVALAARLAAAKTDPFVDAAVARLAAKLR